MLVLMMVIKFCLILLHDDFHRFIIGMKMTDYATAFGRNTGSCTKFGFVLVLSVVVKFQNCFINFVVVMHIEIHCYSLQDNRVTLRSRMKFIGRTIAVFERVIENIGAATAAIASLNSQSPRYIPRASAKNCRCRCRCRCRYNGRASILLLGLFSMTVTTTSQRMVRQRAKRRLKRERCQEMSTAANRQFRRLFLFVRIGCRTRTPRLCRAIWC